MSGGGCAWFGVRNTHLTFPSASTPFPLVTEQNGSFVIVHYSATSNLDIVTGRDTRLLV